MKITSILLLSASLLLSNPYASAAHKQEHDSRGLYPHLENQHLPLPSEEKEPDLQAAFQAGWSSKYISEGIDAFGTGGVWEFNPEIKYKDITFLIWYGLSDSINASELKLLLSYDYHITDKITLTPSYEHAFAYPGNIETDTPALGISYALNDWLTTGVDMQADATNNAWKGYYDVYMEYSWALNESITLTACVLYAFNDGYLGPDVTHGPNTLDYSLSANIKITDDFCYVCSANYSQSLSALRQSPLYDEETGQKTHLGNELWFGSYFHYQF